MAKLSDEELDRETDRQFAAWRAEYGSEPEEPRAESVEFDLNRRVMLLNLSDSRQVELPLDDIQGLAFASPAQIHEFELLGRGTGMDWPSLGVSFSVEGLLQGCYGNQLWMEALRRREQAANPEPNQAANGAKRGKPSAA